MTQYDNTNKGALFRNNRKTSDSYPDFSGSVNVNGHDFWISAWVKQDKNGNNYFSLSTRAKDGTSSRPSDVEINHMMKSTKPTASDVALDDEVPF